MLKRKTSQCPGGLLAPCEKQRSDEIKAMPLDKSQAGKFFIHYFGNRRPSFRDYYIDDDTEYEAFVVDTWECTQVSKGVFKGKFRVELPPKPYMAVMLKAK